MSFEYAKRINSLKSGIEAKTGETYADLTEGVQALVDGYRKGEGGSQERTAWYRPPDMPDYSSLNLSDNEAYAFFTYDTQLPIDDSQKVATFGWTFYSYGNHDSNYFVNVDRGHIENGKFVIDERILENQNYSRQESVNIPLPTDAGRFVVYRVSSNNPSLDKDLLWVRMYDTTNEGMTIYARNTPCVETFLYHCGGHNNVAGNSLSTIYTKIYTAINSYIHGGSSEFYRKHGQAPEVIIYDNVTTASQSGYYTFNGLGTGCKYIYILNSNITLGRMAGMFQGASGLTLIDFTGTAIETNSMANFFNGCINLRRLDLSGWSLENVTNMSNTFYDCSSLYELILGDRKLPKVLMNFSSCHLLSKESVLGIVNALQQLDEGETFTLQLGPTNVAKLTDEEKAIATEKGWTLA